MYELTGKIKELNIDYRTGNALMTLSLNEKKSAMNCFDSFNGEDKLSIKVDKHREKRSIDANALCWKLCTEIANILRLSKEEVYLQMLKDYGQSSISFLEKGKNPKLYFKYYEEIEDAYGKNGKLYTFYKVYAGSSGYNTQEMSILLDGIVEEAKQLDIPVWSKKEIELVKERWGEFE